MKKRRACRSRGFTLVESIIVIVLLAIAVVGIVSMQSRIFSGQSSLKDIQVGTKLMQECAEQVLGTRRVVSGGYAAVSTPTFSVRACGITVSNTVSPYTPTVTLKPYTGNPGCPTEFNCKLVKISQEGMSDLTVLLVDY